MKKSLFCFLTLLTICGSFLVIAKPSQATSEQQDDSITIAMTAAFVSEKGIDVYEDIADYLEKKTGMKTDFLTGLSYSAVNAVIESGEADFAFVCGYPYILSHDGKDNPATKLLVAPVNAAPVYESKPKYYSYVIVHKDSPITKFEELKGKTWVYNDSISNSGYNMPRAKLVSIGETEGFFGKVLQSGAHEESVRMVAAGEADASAVDSLVLDYALSENEEYAKNVKIIEKLGPAGAPPVIHSTKLSPEVVEKFKNALLDMKNDPEGQAILKKAYLSEFVVVDDTNYDDIRAMAQSAKDANYMEMK